MKVILETSKCIGCGACAAICPQVFEIGTDGKSHLIKGTKGPAGREELVSNEPINGIDDAVNGCPVQAIKTEK